MWSGRIKESVRNQSDVNSQEIKKDVTLTAGGEQKAAAAHNVGKTLPSKKRSLEQFQLETLKKNISQVNRDANCDYVVKLIGRILQLPQEILANEKKLILLKQIINQYGKCPPVSLTSGLIRSLPYVHDYQRDFMQQVNLLFLEGTMEIYEESESSSSYSDETESTSSVSDEFLWDNGVSDLLENLKGILTPSRRISDEEKLKKVKETIYKSGRSMDPFIEEIVGYARRGKTVSPDFEHSLRDIIVPRSTIKL